MKNRGVIKTPKTSEMESFTKIIKGFQPLINASKLSATSLNGIYDIKNFVVNVTWQTK